MAVSLKTPKHYRAWEKSDSYEHSDIVRLFDTEKVKSTKAVHCSKYFTVYSTLVGFFVLFLLGILVGFLLRDDQAVTDICANSYPRKDGFDREKLQAVHNNVVYYMTKDKIRDLSRELSALVKSSSKEEIDKLSAEFVAAEFKKFGMDRVDIEQHDIVVSSPDPENPNRLEILTPDGSIKRNFNLTKGDKSSQVVDFSPAGKVKGPVVFGNYGRPSDFMLLRKWETQLKGSVVLLKLGLSSVANKIHLATRLGCSAVLLYCDVEDSCCHGNHCSNDEIPDDSSNYFTEFQSIDPPVIPVQTVSHSIAMTLLEAVNQTNHQNGSKDFETFTNSSDGSTLVLLEVYTKQVIQTINNVVATIYGEQESDRMVVIGSQRYNYDKNMVHYANSGILLEVARSMGYIRQRELWQPRRTVRFVSLGSSLPHVGLQQYFLSQKHILQQEGVAFIDLDLGHNQSKVTEFKTDITLLNLIKKAYNMVPDPLNPEISLAEGWPDFHQDSHAANWNAANLFGANEYSLSHELGISSISIQSLPVRDFKLSMNLLPRERNSELKYELAVGRVASLTSLMLLDSPVLPFNISLFTEVIKNSINHTIEEIKTNLNEIDLILSKVKELSHMAKSMTASLKDCSKVRVINDALMRFENIFSIERSDGNNQFLDGQTGTLSAVLNALDGHALYANEDTVKHLLQMILSMLQEALHEIESLAG